MMSIKQKLTGKPSIDRPWMQYYPQEMIENLTVPNSTIYEYLMYNCPGDDVVAIHYYGRDITWKQIKEETDKVARALKAVGFGENDEIPMFLRSVPEFIFLLLGAEKIGASLLCRDNTIEENVAAVKKAGAKIIFAHDFLSQEDFNKFRACGVREAILLSPLRSADKSTLPDYSLDFLNSQYTDYPAYGPCIFFVLVAFLVSFVVFFAAVVVAVLLAFSTAFFATSCACVASLVASEVVVSSFDAVEASVAVAAATVGIGIMLTLTVKTVNHARIFFIFLIVPPSHELMC